MLEILFYLKIKDCFYHPNHMHFKCPCSFAQKANVFSVDKHEVQTNRLLTIGS